MPIFQNLKCWLADNEGNILPEQGVSDVNSVVTTSIMTQESQVRIHRLLADVCSIDVNLSSTAFHCLLEEHCWC